ncbi:MAG TPA: bifunctional DNA primase/polymerase [Xanthobacteraceae bacterium]
MMRTAMALAAKGLAVFPCAVRQKRPATKHGVKDATTDQTLIETWWRSNQQYNVAIATGKVSGVFVVDIDGLDAEAELRNLELEHSKLPTTVEAITPRGRHIYFKMPDVPVCNSISKIAPSIDVRGDNGYVLTPPSIHPSGRPYWWSVDSHDKFAAAPEWLVAKITDRPNDNGKLPTPPSEWRELVMAGVAEGQRDNTVTRLCGHLLRHHVDPIVALGLLQAWNATSCTPPLPAEDIERIVNSIAGKELARRQAFG